MYTLYAYKVCWLYFYLQEGLNGNFLVLELFTETDVSYYWTCYKNVCIYV